MNGSLVSVISTKGGDETVFPFVEAYHDEFVRGKQNHSHLTCVQAFEKIGDRRAIPYMREIFSSTERKSDAAEANGRMMLDRQIKPQNLVDESMAQNIRLITEPNQPDEKRSAAWQELLLTPEKSFDRVLVNSPLRTALEDSGSEWDNDDDPRGRFIAGFGDVATARLLKESEGCSLPKRYRISHLLRLLLPGSRAMIEAAANDQTTDDDRRRTAQLALTLNGDRRMKVEE